MSGPKLGVILIGILAAGAFSVWLIAGCRDRSIGETSAVESALSPVLPQGGTSRPGPVENPRGDGLAVAPNMGESPEELRLRVRLEIEQLRSLVRNKDQVGIDRHMDGMSVPSVIRENELLALLEQGDPEIPWHAGVILGRIGDASTLKRGLDLLTIRSTPGEPSASLQGRAPKTPVEQTRLADAVALNLLKHLLARGENRDAIVGQALAFAVTPQCPTWARMRIVMCILGSASVAEIERVAIAIEAVEDDAIQTDLVSGMASTNNPLVALKLIEWYGRYPQFRRQIAVSLATTLPIDDAYRVLRELFQSLSTDHLEDSAAVSGIALLGTRSESFAVLEKFFLDEDIVELKSALLTALVNTGDRRAQEMVVQVIRSDQPTAIRANAFALLQMCQDPVLAWEVVRAGAVAEKDGEVRRRLINTVLGMYAREVCPKVEARSVLADEIASTAADPNVEDLLRRALKTAEQAHDTPDFKKALRERLAAGGDSTAIARLTLLVDTL